MAAPKRNKNAEKWDLKTATEFMKEALSLSEDRDYDFIGELARDQKTHKHAYGYIAKKFPDLQDTLDKIIGNCESNCFYNGKKGNIVPSLAIMNLKSNHGWTDRVDQTTKGDKIEPPSIRFTDGSGD